MSPCLFPRLQWWGREKGGEEGKHGCERGERLGEEGKRTGGEEEFSVGEFTKSTVIS